jgi:type II secretory pathway component PulM
VELKSIFRTISGREKALAAAAGFIVVVFLVYQFVFVPLFATRENLEYTKTELGNQLGNIKVLAERYEAERGSYENIRTTLERKQGVSVLTYLENESRTAGIRDNIDYVRPRGEQTRDGIRVVTVEVKIDAIPMRDLLLFLTNLEQHRDGLTITYLRLKPYFKDREKVDVFVRVSDVTVK